LQKLLEDTITTRRAASQSQTQSEPKTP